MAAEDGYKTCRYKVKDGEVISQLFPMGSKDWKIPKGWYESPKAAKAKAASLATEDPVDIPTAERLEVEDNDNSAGTDQHLSEAGGNTGRGSDAGSGNQLGCLEPYEQDAI